MKQIFFQSSLPRSGSTLLQNILGQNTDFYVTPTSGLLELVYAARNNYSTSPEFKAQDAELMKKGFDHKYWDYRNKKFDRILVALSSPWFIPKIKHVQIMKDTPFTITEDFIEDILKKEEEIFKNELNKDFEGLIKHLKLPS